MGFLDEVDANLDLAKVHTWRHVDAHDQELMTHLPGNYSYFMKGSYDGLIPYSKAFYLKVLKELNTMEI